MGKERFLICYRCGSENIEFLRENDRTRIYKCKECGRVIIKRKRGEDIWQDYITTN